MGLKRNIDQAARARLREILMLDDDLLSLLCTAPQPQERIFLIWDRRVSRSIPLVGKILRSHSAECWSGAVRSFAENLPDWLNSADDLGEETHRALLALRRGGSSSSGAPFAPTNPIDWDADWHGVRLAQQQTSGRPAEAAAQLSQVQTSRCPAEAAEDQPLDQQEEQQPGAPVPPRAQPSSGNEPPAEPRPQRLVGDALESELLVWLHSGRYQDPYWRGLELNGLQLGSLETEPRSEQQCSGCHIVQLPEWRCKVKDCLRYCVSAKAARRQECHIIAVCADGAWWSPLITAQLELELRSLGWGARRVLHPGLGGSVDDPTGRRCSTCRCSVAGQAAIVLEPEWLPSGRRRAASLPAPGQASADFLIQRLRSSQGRRECRHPDVEVTHAPGLALPEDQMEVQGGRIEKPIRVTLL